MKSSQNAQTRPSLKWGTSNGVLMLDFLTRPAPRRMGRLQTDMTQMHIILREQAGSDCAHAVSFQKSAQVSYHQT